MNGPTWLDIINTLLETAVLAVILLDIKLYYNREKKQEIRDQNQDARDEKYLRLQEQVVKLLTQQVTTTEELIEEVIEIQPTEVIPDEPDTNRNELGQQAGEAQPSSPSADTPADPGSVGQREVMASSVTS